MEFSLLFVFLLLFVAVVSFVLSRLLTERRLHSFYRREIVSHRKDAVSRSRSVLGGQFSEQLAPFLPSFPFSPTEVKFLGSPVDFLVFRGSDRKKVEEVVFVEVKSGKSSLNKQEHSLKKAVSDKKVSWFEYRIPDDLTKQKE